MSNAFHNGKFFGVLCVRRAAQADVFHGVLGKRQSKVKAECSGVIARPDSFCKITDVLQIFQERPRLKGLILLLDVYKRLLFEWRR